MVQMTWWLRPACLCLPEKLVLPSERHFQTGMSVPSMTSDPGGLSALSRVWMSGLKIFTSAFSIRLIVLETVGWDTS